MPGQSTRETHSNNLLKTKHRLLTACVFWWLQVHSNPLAPKPGQPPVPIFAELGKLLLRTPSYVFGYLPVMFMCLGSALWVFIVSLLTRPPSRATLEKFFPVKRLRASLAEPAPVIRPIQFMDILTAIQANLLSPAVLFFVLGLIAALTKRDLKFPEPPYVDSRSIC